MQSCLHGKDESKTKYSASQITLIAWTTHPKNKQGIQAEKTSTKNLHSPVSRQHLHSITTIQLHLTNSRLLENTSRQCIRVLFESKNPDKCSEATTGEDFSSSNKSDSRPSNSLFQTARGSGATLSECTFSSKKRTSLERLLQDSNFQTT